MFIKHLISVQENCKFIKGLPRFMKGWVLGGFYESLSPFVIKPVV
jgi:hypothetical protein